MSDEKQNNKGIRGLSDEDLGSVSGGALGDFIIDGTASIAQGELMNNLWDQIRKWPNGKNIISSVNAYVKSRGLQKYNAAKARYVSKQAITVAVSGKKIKVNGVEIFY